MHPEFQLISRQNDLALVRLSSIVPYQRRISPICLPTPGNFFHLIFSIFFIFHYSNWIGWAITEMSYDRLVATIASWIGGLSSDNNALTSCHPRKIDLPILHTEACSGALIESQGCVGVVGARSTLCKVNCILVQRKFHEINLFHWNRMTPARLFYIALLPATMNSSEFSRIIKIAVHQINHQLALISIYRCTPKSTVT